MYSNSCLVAMSFSGQNRLALFDTGGPVVSITCSTPCVVCLCVIDVLIISGNLLRIFLNGQSSANAVNRGIVLLTS